MPEVSNIAGNSSQAPSVASAAVGSATGGLFGLFSSALNYHFNKKLAEQQNAYNLEMWKMNNEYNSPQAQMQRFKDAGLNPNLIYGNGTPGNSSQSPQMVTPQAPDTTKAMEDLARAFNIENLRTTVANRKKAQADALNSSVDAERNKLNLQAEYAFGQGWTFDYNTGRYVRRPLSNDGTVEVVHPGSLYYNRLLENNYLRSSLIPYRASLLEHQARYLAPQITMANYEAKYIPYSYWIGQGSKVLNSLTGVPKIFSPLSWKFRPATNITKTNNFNY